MFFDCDFNLEDDFIQPYQEQTKEHDNIFIKEDEDFFFNHSVPQAINHQQRECQQLQTTTEIQNPFLPTYREVKFTKCSSSKFLVSGQVGRAENQVPTKRNISEVLFKYESIRTFLLKMYQNRVYLDPKKVSEREEFKCASSMRIDLLICSEMNDFFFSITKGFSIKKIELRNDDVENINPSNNFLQMMSNGSAPAAAERLRIFVNDVSLPREERQWPNANFLSLMLQNAWKFDLLKQITFLVTSLDEEYSNKDGLKEKIVKFIDYLQRCDEFLKTFFAEGQRIGDLIIQNLETITDNGKKNNRPFASIYNAFLKAMQKDVLKNVCQWMLLNTQISLQTLNELMGFSMSTLSLWSPIAMEISRFEQSDGLSQQSTKCKRNTNYEKKREDTKSVNHQNCLETTKAQLAKFLLLVQQNEEKWEISKTFVSSTNPLHQKQLSQIFYRICAWLQHEDMRPLLEWIFQSVFQNYDEEAKRKEQDVDQIEKKTHKELQLKISLNPSNFVKNSVQYTIDMLKLEENLRNNAASDSKKKMLYVYGQSNTGKTYFTEQLLLLPFRRTKGKTSFFNDQISPEEANNASFLIFDDPQNPGGNGNAMTKTTILNLADNNNKKRGFSLNQKYGSISFQNSTQIIFISNLLPKELFKKDDDPITAAFESRLITVQFKVFPILIASKQTYNLPLTTTMTSSSSNSNNTAFSDIGVGGRTNSMIDDSEFQQKRQNRKDDEKEVNHHTLFAGAAAEEEQNFKIVKEGWDSTKSLKGNNEEDYFEIGSQKDPLENRPHRGRKKKRSAKQKNNDDNVRERSRSLSDHSNVNNPCRLSSIKNNNSEAQSLKEDDVWLQENIPIQEQPILMSYMLWIAILYCLEDSILQNLENDVWMKYVFHDKPNIITDFKKHKELRTKQKNISLPTDLVLFDYIVNKYYEELQEKTKSSSQIR